jgi:PAS domain S-box-containing protein
MQPSDIHDFSSLIRSIDAVLFFYVYDTEGKFTYVSPSQKAVLGYSDKEFLRSFPTFLTDSPVNEQAIAHTRRAISGEKQPPCEIETVDKNGLHKCLRLFEQPCFNDDGSVKAVHGVAEDITKQKQQEKAFLRNEGVFKRAQQMAKIGSWYLDIKKNRLQWSDEIYRIFERDPKRFEASYDAFLDAIHPDDVESVNRAYLTSLEEKNPYRIEHRLLMPDGRIKYVNEECETLFDETGEPVSSFGTVQDVTEMRQLQIENETNRELMFHQSKMAMMGEMINNIAHQWKQPLHQINSVLPSIENDYGDGTLTKETLSGKLDEIEMLTNHLAQTIESFKNFFHPEKEKTAFSIADALDKAFLLFRGELERENIICELSLRRDAFARGSEKDFVQAVLIILNNAKECFSHRDVKAPKIIISVGGDEQENCVIFSDNAGGIADAFVDKIFDPYFTTKRKGHGTGLGLYIASMLIETSLLGTLTAENSIDGASFTIHLPREKQA